METIKVRTFSSKFSRSRRSSSFIIEQRRIVVLLSFAVALTHGEILCPYCPNCNVTEPTPVNASCCSLDSFWIGKFKIVGSHLELSRIIENLTSSSHQNCRNCSFFQKHCLKCKRVEPQGNVTCDECNNKRLRPGINGQCEIVRDDPTDALFPILGAILGVVLLLAAAVIFYYLVTRSRGSSKDKPPSLPTSSQLDWPPSRSLNDANAGRKLSVLRYIRTPGATTNGSMRFTVPSVHYQSTSHLATTADGTEDQPTVVMATKNTKAPQPFRPKSGKSAQNIDNNGATSMNLTIDQENVYSNTSCDLDATSSFPEVTNHTRETASNVPDQEEYANFHELTAQRVNAIQAEDDGHEFYANIGFEMQKR